MRAFAVCHEVNGAEGSARLGGFLGPVAGGATEINGFSAACAGKSEFCKHPTALFAVITALFPVITALFPERPISVVALLRL